MRYGQADVPREVSGRGGPAVRPAAADFPRDVCLTVSRNHAVFLLYIIFYFKKKKKSILAHEGVEQIIRTIIIIIHLF